MDQSQIGIAAELLRITSIEALRKEARRNRRWVAIYPGFRADSLTRPQLVRGSSRFVGNAAELYKLCAVFLDSVGVADSKDQRARFAEAAKLSTIDQETKDLCSLLASTDVLSLPRIADEHGETVVETPPTVLTESPGSTDAGLTTESSRHEGSGPKRTRVRRRPPSGDGEAGVGS